MKTKAQAALEFLMTYGWAILLVIVVVGALYATGMLKPCRWVGTQIKDFPLSEFKVEHVVTNTTHIVLRVTYLQPREINVTRIVAEEATKEGAPLQINWVDGRSFTLRSNQAEEVVLSFQGDVKTGDCISFKLRIEYLVEGHPAAVEGRVSTVA